MNRDIELTRLGDLCHSIYYETCYLGAKIITVVLSATHLIGPTS